MRDLEIRNQHFSRLVSRSDLRWMGQNTNHFTTHPSVREAMIRSIIDEEYHIYAPPVGLEELRDLVARDLGLERMAVLITDGAISGLYHVCHALLEAGDEFVTTDPSWAWPMAFAESVGAKVTQIPIYGPEHGYRLDPQRLRKIVSRKTKIIYLVDPNNPLGNCFGEEEIEQIGEIARSVDALLVHDCTYRDFAYEHHLAAKFYPEKTITAWSFSKWLGFAGLRVGSITTSPDIAESLAKAPPNNLGSNIVAQRGAIAGLRTKAEWFPDVLEETRENQRLVRMAAEAIPGFKVPVFPSNGNFLVLECIAAGVKPEVVCAMFGKRNVMVRHGAYHTKSFGDRFIKVSVSVPHEWVKEFCELLPNVVEEARDVCDDIKLF